MLELVHDKLLFLEELPLMNYMRKDIVLEVFTQYPIDFILAKSPNVHLED